MFGYKEEKFNIIKPDDSLFECTRETMQEVFKDNLYNSLIESDTNVNTSSLKVISSRLVKSLDSTINTIQTNTNNAVNFINISYKYLDKSVSQNNYLKTPDSIKTEELIGLYCDKIEYSLTSLPVNVQIESLRKVINNFMTIIPTKDTVKDIKRDIEKEMRYVRGKMLKMEIPINEEDFDTVYMKKFKSESSYGQIQMNVKAVKTLLENIDGYQKDRDNIITSSNTMIAIISTYKGYIEKLFSLTYEFDKSSVRLLSGSNIVQIMSMKDFGYHNNLRNLILSNITYIISLYTALFNYKLSMLQEKIKYEKVLLIRVIDYFNGKDATHNV